MLRVLYIIAIGLLFAGVVGLGVSTFYKSPQRPACERTEPVPVKESATPAPETAEDIAAAAECRNQQESWNEQNQTHQLYSSLIYMGIAVVVLIISLFGLGTIPVIGDGIMLGGVFILFVGLIMSLSTGNDAFRFFAVLFGLIVVLALSYWKFIRGHEVSERI